jgi:hypothetical protein
MNLTWKQFTRVFVFVIGLKNRTYTRLKFKQPLENWYLQKMIVGDTFIDQHQIYLLYS